MRRSLHPVALALLMLIGVGTAVGAWWLLDGGPRTGEVIALPTVADTGESGGMPPDTSDQTHEVPDPAPTPTDTQDAPSPLEELEMLRQQSLSSTSLDGRFVAQLASKADGITDPAQVAANGTTTFYVADILAEYLEIRERPGLTGQVLLLGGGDFGKGSDYNGRTIWVTLYDGGFESSDDVKGWCASSHPTLSGAELDNVCVPRTLRPPEP